MLNEHRRSGYFPFESDADGYRRCRCCLPPHHQSAGCYRGTSIAMVYRAKAFVQDMEFIQFHPTALYHPGDRPVSLITEAMRGNGAVLRNMGGEEFMQNMIASFSCSA